MFKLDELTYYFTVNMGFSKVEFKMMNELVLWFLFVFVCFKFFFFPDAVFRASDILCNLLFRHLRQLQIKLKF